MRRQVTQLLENFGLVHNRDFHWFNNQGIDELCLAGDIHDREAQLVQVVDELHKVSIPFQIHKGERLRFRSHP